MSADGRPARSDRFQTVVGLLIILAAVLSALVGWRASTTSARASRFDRSAIQQRVQQGQIIGEEESTVTQDLRILGAFQEHVKAWRLLDQDSAKERASNPALADLLEAQAQGELALARSMKQFFLGGDPGLGDDNGTVQYDPSYVLQALQSVDTELPTLRPSVATHMAEKLHRETVRLVGTAALLILALFFLTVAQVARRTRGRLFAVAGSLVVVAGVVVWAVVEASGA